MNCHDIGRGMDSVTQFVIKMYDAGGNLWVSIFKNTGLFHPDETSRWSRFVYSLFSTNDLSKSTTEPTIYGQW